jgi:hypothetical protein
MDLERCGSRYYAKIILRARPQLSQFENNRLNAAAVGQL